VTPAPRSPPPAATAWRTRAPPNDDRLDNQLADVEAHMPKPGRGEEGRHERATQLVGSARAVTARRTGAALRDGHAMNEDDGVGGGVARRRGELQRR
jgi:hypothetical protein